MKHESLPPEELNCNAYKCACILWPYLDNTLSSQQSASVPFVFCLLSRCFLKPKRAIILPLNCPVVFQLKSHSFLIFPHLSCDKTLSYFKATLPSRARGWIGNISNAMPDPELCTLLSYLHDLGLS